MENEKAVGPNVILFKLLTGRRKDKRWYVGCYLPPSDKEGETHRRTKAALDAQPVETRLLLLGNLNADLDCPRTVCVCVCVFGLQLAMVAFPWGRSCA